MTESQHDAEALSAICRSNDLLQDQPAAFDLLQHGVKALDNALQAMANVTELIDDVEEADKRSDCAAGCRFYTMAFRTAAATWRPFLSELNRVLPVIYPLRASTVVRNR